MNFLSETLKRLESMIQHYDRKDIEMFHADYRRRAELLKVILDNIPVGSTMLDAGSAPGFMSLALKFTGYKVQSLDINPEPYLDVFKTYGVEVLKVDLERDKIPLSDESIDCVVFTEVLEHLHPYYLSWTCSEINRVLKRGGLLFLTTPNMASIGKRVKLLRGMNPLSNTHVREYTVKEVVKLLTEHGYSIIKRGFSLSYNLTPHDANRKDYIDNLFIAFFKYPSKENLFHLLTLPLVFAIPSLRATISLIARKDRYTKPRILHRRF